MVILTYKVREKHAFSKNLEDHPPPYTYYSHIILQFLWSWKINCVISCSLLRGILIKLKTTKSLSIYLRLTTNVRSLLYATMVVCQKSIILAENRQEKTTTINAAAWYKLLHLVIYLKSVSFRRNFWLDRKYS